MRNISPPAIQTEASDCATPLAPGLLRPGVPLWIATLTACLCSFMVITDGAIVSLALPAMRADLGLTLLGQQWVVDAEKLTLGGFMLLTARAGDIFGRRTVLLLGLGLFLLASVASAMATSPVMLIASRAVQGIGASALATSTLAVIVSAWSRPADRERAIGLWTAAGAVAATFGFLAGGASIGVLSWRWAMVLNVPVGAALGLIVMTCFSPQRSWVPRQAPDIQGAISITAAMASLLYAITHLGTLGWRAPSVIVAMCAAIIALLLFVIVEARSAHPLIRLTVFRTPTVRLGAMLIGCLGALLSASMFFMPLMLQQVSGYTPLESGAAMLPLALLLGIAPLFARPLRRMGDRVPPVLGFAVAGCGLLWLGRIPALPAYAVDVLPATVLIGAGIGLAMVSITRIFMASVAIADAGLASGLHNTARQLGGAIGIAGLVALAHALSGGGGTGQSVSAGKLVGFHAAFMVAGIFSLVLAGAAAFLRMAQDEGSETR